MPAAANIVSVEIKLDGTLVPAEVMDDLHLLEVDASLHMPASATIELYDRDLKWVDDSRFKIGADIQVTIKSNAAVGENNSSANTDSVFQGVIAALDPYFSSAAAYAVMVIRAYDRSYLLHRGTKTKTYLNQKDSDIARQIIGDAGLSAEVAATSKVWDHIFRGDLTDYDFLKMLAARNGFVVVSKDRKIVVKSPTDLGLAEVALEYGENLLEFRPSLSMTGQVDEVRVGGWDRKKKQAVTGVAASVSFEPSSTGFGSRGPALAKTAHGARVLHVTHADEDQASAESLAKAFLNRLAANDMTGEGTAYGDPRIKPGCKVALTSIGTRFGGSYLVTRVRHRVAQREGYTSEFWIGGMNSGSVASLLTAPPHGSLARNPVISGLATGIVTNITDPEGIGRVKVKFPQLSETEESWWAPVIGAGAGNGRGLMVLPEVNDEVLVGFAYGDINRPYVLGGLWNGTDSMPDTAVANGKVEIRTFKTRAGHVLRFTDESGSEKIELIDKTTKNLLTIDSATGDIVMKASGNMTFEATGKMTLKAANVKIEGQGKIEAGAASIAAEAQGQLTLKGAMAELGASGITKVSGSMVQIN